MAALLTPERILPMLRAAGAPAVLRVLARLAAAETGLHEETVLDAIRARGRLTAFGVGRGVAVPHALLGGIAEPIGVFAHLQNPADFGAADARPVGLVFLLLVPAAEAHRLLPLLASVVRRLRDREVLKHLRGDAGAAASFAVLTTEAWRGLHRPVPSAGLTNRGL